MNELAVTSTYIAANSGAQGPAAGRPGCLGASVAPSAQPARFGARDARRRRNGPDRHIALDMRPDCPAVPENVWFAGPSWNVPRQAAEELARSLASASAFWIADLPSFQVPVAAHALIVPCQTSRLSMKRTSEFGSKCHGYASSILVTRTR